MQLKKQTACGKPLRRIGGSLATATCTLLGPIATSSVAAQELEPWSIDSAMLYYAESGGRVRDFSINALAKRELREDSFLTLKMAVDTLTGASPSGAAPSTVPQTFTRPSGRDSYTIAAGELPLDDSFQDTRWAFSADYAWPLARLSTLDVGVSVSDEYDYAHAGINASLARDFNNRNTTLSLGVALANETIDPVGGAPAPLSPMLPDDDDDDDGAVTLKQGEQSKDVTDLLIGVTQVLNRHALVQLNYSVSRSDGYLSDPYKLLSVVDPVTGLPVAGVPGSGLNLYWYESRPETRDKQSLFGLYKRDFADNVFDVSYRYMTDDWEIDSHTIDVHYRFRIGDGRRYLQPHVRFYTQTEASFYHTVLFDGSAVPAFASADYRLGAFDAVTVGLKYGQDTRHGEIDARFEVYRQSGTASPGAAVGALSNLDLYPDLSAVIAQFSYKFGR